MKTRHGKLILLPTPLSADGFGHLPQNLPEILDGIDEFIVENERTARRFLIKAGISRHPDEFVFHLLNKFTEAVDLDAMHKELEGGKTLGLVSEAGLPAIADPGSDVIARAQSAHIPVVPVAGPSSIFMALMASGFNGQRFRFRGYLPIEKDKRKKTIAHLEDESSKRNETQIFIETPFRNNHMLKDILDICAPETLLCLATNITAGNESIQTRSIAQWKKNTPDFHKKPTVFLIMKRNPRDHKRRK